MRAFAIVALALLSTGALAQTQSYYNAFVERVIGHSLGEYENYACFVRTYEKSHMRRHPQQQTTDISLLVDYDGLEPELMGLILGVRRKGDKTLWRNSAACQLHSDDSGGLQLSCGVPACGFIPPPIGFTALAKSSVQLAFPDTFGFPDEIDSPHERDFDMNPDDREFVLYRAPLARCAALSPHKGFPEKPWLRGGARE